MLGESIQLLHEVALNMLLKHLKVGHPNREGTEQRLYSLRAGIAGEQKVLQYLSRLNMAFEVLWDINLKVTPGHYVQIDVLVLTPFRAMILEAKNMADRLRFESSPARLDKVDEGGRIIASYDCPMLQLQEEMDHLRHWFYIHDIPCHVDGAVVMTGSALIEKVPQEGKLFRLRQIRRHLSDDDAGEGGRTRQELAELADYMVKRNEPYLPFPLTAKIGISVEEIDWRPVCEGCCSNLARVTERRWVCVHCLLETSDPYTPTLEKWFLLGSRTITNGQVRKLFDITQTAAANLLGKYPLIKTGQARSTRYYWDYNGRLKRKGSESGPWA